MSRAVPRPHAERRRLSTQLLVFAAGVASGIQVANVTATGLSVLCLAVIPAWVLMRHRGADLLPLLFAALGWIAYAASGALHGVSLLWPNALAPAAFSVYFIGVTVMTDRRVDALATLLAGIGAGTMVFFLTEGIELTNTGRFPDVWKYGIAHGVTVVTLFVLALGRWRPLVAPLTLCVVGLVSLVLNFRSNALVCLLAAAILLVRPGCGGRLGQRTRWVVVAGCGLVVAYAVPLAARLGAFGMALQHKTIEQQATNLPTLLAGRTELPMSLAAIAEHPLMGWGSSEHLDPQTYTNAEHLAVSMGFSPTFAFELYWRLPASDYSAMHSLLLGSWAEGGILALLLPLWLMMACAVVVWRYRHFGPWAPVILVVALQGIWDLLYSPWTYNTLAEFACVAVLFCNSRARHAAAGP